jgi:hypothetical protein
MRNLLSTLLLALGCASPPSGFEERLVDSIPEGLHVRSWRFSRDGRSVAYVRFDKPAQDCVIVNGVAGKPLSLI